MDSIIPLDHGSGNITAISLLKLTLKWLILIFTESNFFTAKAETWDMYPI